MTTTTQNTTKSNAITTIVAQATAKKATAKKATAKKTTAKKVSPLARALAKTVSTVSTVAPVAPVAQSHNRTIADKKAVAVNPKSFGAITFTAIGKQTKALNTWFSKHEYLLLKVTKVGNVQLDTARVYCAIFDVTWDSKANGPIKAQPFYTELRNALGYYARTNKLLPEKGKTTPTHDGIVTAIIEYLESKEKGAALEAVEKWLVDNKPAID